MRKFFAVLMATIMLSTGVPVVAETSSNIDVVFNRVHLVVNNVATNTTTLLYDGRTYIQLAGAATAFNANLDWNSDTNTAYLVTNTDSQSTAASGKQEGEESQTISVMFDRVKLNVNGNTTDTTTLLYDGRTYIQLSGASAAFNAQLDWDGATNTAYLSTDGSISDSKDDPSDIQGAQLALELDIPPAIKSGSSFAQSEEDVYFRSSVWGMTMDDVKAVETLELFDEDSKTLFYRSPVDDENAVEMMIYCFNSKGELYQGVQMNQWFYSSTADYLYIYQCFRYILIELLGTPYYDDAAWVEPISDFDSYSSPEGYDLEMQWVLSNGNRSIAAILTGEDNIITISYGFCDLTRFEE